MRRQLEEGEIMFRLSPEENRLLLNTLSRDREKKKVKAFLGEQATPPPSMIRAIKHIMEVYKNSPIGLWQAWSLGVIYGKRRDRKRRKRSAANNGGHDRVTSNADCTDQPQEKEKALQVTAHLQGSPVKANEQHL